MLLGEVTPWEMVPRSLVLTLAKEIRVGVDNTMGSSVSRIPLRPVITVESARCAEKGGVGPGISG